MYKILIVEDDSTITQVLARQLTKWGYLVEFVTDFEKVIFQFEAFQPHLVLLDISLPFFNGYHWCTEIRKISKTPIVFISSAQDDMSLVMAINLGADDFVAKPFTLEVITAKLQAILRRAYSFAPDSDVLQYGSIALYTKDFALIYGSEKIELTKNELRILQLLMEAKGNIVKRDTIIKALWDTESFIDDNTLTVNMTRLRKKLESVKLQDFIATKKGIGYYAVIPT